MAKKKSTPKQQAEYAKREQENQELDAQALLLAAVHTVKTLTSDQHLELLRRYMSEEELTTLLAQAYEQLGPS